MRRRAWSLLALLAVLPLAALAYYVTTERGDPPPDVPDANGGRAPRAAPPAASPTRSTAPRAPRPPRTGIDPGTGPGTRPGSEPPAGDAVVVGKIVDENDCPVPDAAVSLWTPARPTEAFGGFGRLLTARRMWIGTFRTKADGTFRFRRLSPDATHTIRIRHAEMAPAARTFRLTRYPAPTDLGVLRVSRGGTIRGRCVDERGRPIEGAAVFAVQMRSSGEPPTGLPADVLEQAELEKRSPWVEVRSGADGRFTLTGTPIGEVRAAAIKAGRRAGASAGVRLVSGGVAERARIVMPLGHVISGRVVDHRDRPVAGASVQVQPMGEGRPAPVPRSVASSGGIGMVLAPPRIDVLGGDRLVETDDDGRFRADGLAAGGHRLVAWRGGRVAVKNDVQAGDESVIVAFEPVEEVVVRGTVVARGAGTPIADARIWLTLDVTIDQNPGRRPDAVSDATGAFEIVTIAGRGRRKLRVEAGGYALEESAPFSVETAPPEMQITLDAGAVLRGRVVAAGSADPIDGAVVFLRADPVTGLSPFGGLAFEQLRPAVARAVTDADGRFRIDRVAPGRYRLDVRHAVFAKTTKRGIVLGRGDVLDDLQIALAMGGTVVVECRYTDATPAPGVRVDILTAVARPTRGGLRFREPATIVDTAESDAAGVVTFRRLEAGRYVLRWREAGSARDALAYADPASPAFVVTAGARIVRQVRLERGVAIEGLVRDAGRPVAGAIVSLLLRVPVSAGTGGSPGGEPLSVPRTWSSTTDEAGRFRLTNVKPGEGHVSVRVVHRGERYVALHDTVTVPATSTHRMALTLPSASIRGRVHRPAAGDGDDPDRPIDLVLRRVDRARMYRSIDVGADGHYRFDHVPPGKYELVVRPTAAWAGARRGDLIVDAGAMLLGIDLHLAMGVTVTGIVVDENDRPVRGARIEARPESPAARRTTTIGRGATNDVGRFEMTKLRPGTYLFRATWRKSRSDVVGVYVSEGAMEPVKLRVRPYRR